MKKTRIFFLLISLFGSVLIAYQVPEWRLWLVMFVGMGMASLVILVDLLLRGGPLRGLCGAVCLRKNDFRDVSTGCYRGLGLLIKPAWSEYVKKMLN